MTPNRSFSFFTLTLLVLLASTSCNYLPTNKPFQPLSYASPSGTPGQDLVVFVRGLGGSHASFDREGLIAELHSLHPGFEAIAPNSHFGYYSGRSLIERLRHDIIQPAKARGIENIWLVGVSMGGLGSLLYLTEFPEDIAGVYLVSPFLGYDKVEKQIQQAGSFAEWNPGDTDFAEKWQPAMWNWIKTRLLSETTPPIYLGYGTNDRYVNGQNALAALLPEAQVIRLPGGHDYPTFKALWTAFLAAGHLDASEVSKHIDRTSSCEKTGF